MTISRRIALAFACMLLAFAVFATMGIVPTAVRFGPRYAISTAEMYPIYLFFTLVGWVLALPFVIYFKNADGWRTWAILAIGIAIGPCFMLALPMLGSLVRSGRISSAIWQGEGPEFVMALFIGSLTTLIYVLLLRRFTSKTLASRI